MDKFKLLVSKTTHSSLVHSIFVFTLDHWQQVQVILRLAHFRTSPLPTLDAPILRVARHRTRVELHTLLFPNAAARCIKLRLIAAFSHDDVTAARLNSLVVFTTFPYLAKSIHWQRVQTLALGS